MFDWKWGGHRAERPFHPGLNPPRKSLAAHGAGPLNFPEAVPSLAFCFSVSLPPARVRSGSARPV